MCFHEAKKYGRTENKKSLTENESTVTFDIVLINVQKLIILIFSYLFYVPDPRADLDILIYGEEF